MVRARVGVDWGTTNFRAFRFDGQGAVLETRRAGLGLAHVPDRDFEGVLRAQLADWLTGDPLVVISGMAGSRTGWIEAPYVPCPAAAETLSAARVRAPSAGLEAWIVPGVMTQGAPADVMRGEETQLVGLAEADGLVIMPGTHCKWVRLEGGRIAGFKTYMTGELFSLVRRQSTLAGMIEGDAPDAAAFALGVDRALAEPGLLHLLFTARTEGLFARIAPEALSAYLSGLLIGHEAAEGLRTLGGPPAQANIVAGPELAGLYSLALQRAGVASVPVRDGEEAAARGLWRLSQSIGNS